MSRRRYRRWAAVAGVAGAVVLAVFVYLWLDMRKANEMCAPPDEATQTPVVEPPAPEKLKTPQVSDDNGQAEATQVESPQTPQRAAPEETIGEPNENLDPVAEAWAVVNHIKENLHEWGTFYPEAEKLIDQLLPVWKKVMPDYDHGDMEDAIELLEKLRLYPDPRAAEVFVEYTIEGPGGRRTIEAAIALGPASVPFLMPHFKRDYPYNAYPADIFVPIWQTHRELLDGVAKHLVIPELERSLKVNNMREIRAYLNQLKAALE
ncbi:MAG: hypothetical protein OXT69_07785 [Candidatus Poribacteria bacterium]|nr:hypothetical protein [Candidatus Poribacteria bacterium]